ncbi:MAG: class I SAM-dependent methyltransferase [Chloroflexota bacterium]
MLMVATVCRFQPSGIFEWGTHIGKSARIFYESTAHYRIPAEVHSTDLPDDVGHPEHPHLERGRFVRELPRVHLHQGDGLETSLLIWSEAGRPTGSLFFVDGDHAYESVRREVDGIALAVPDATILVHDTFSQSRDANYNVGPYRAIGDVLGRFPGRFRRHDSGLGLPGMTLLYQAPTNII